MTKRALLPLLALILAAATARAVDVEVKVVGLETAPKGMGTAAQPLRLLPGGQTALPAGIDLKTVDGALGQTPILTQEALQRELPGAQLVLPGLSLVSPVNSPQDARFSSPLSSAEEGKPQASDPALEEVSRLTGAPDSNQEAAGPAEAKTDEQAESTGHEIFDGVKKTDAAAPRAPKGRVRSFLRSAGLTIGRGARRVLPTKLIERFKAEDSGTDEYGGPKKLELSFRGKLAYGAKWALNMIGLGTLLQGAALLLQHFFSWQLHVSDGVLQSTGRVELLARLGPKAIAAALTKDPFNFLFVQLPVATAWEEVTARLLGFGVLWTVLAAVRPSANAVSKFLEKIPDLFNLRKTLQTGLALVAKVSSRAFPIAAALSAWSFASSHFAAWGFSPYFASVHVAMGVSLAYVAYKTRGLLAPFIAHYLYNLLTLTAGLIAIHFLMPMAAQVFALSLGLAGVVSLYVDFRSHQKARAHEKAQRKLDALARSGKAVVPVLLAALIAGSALGPARFHDPRADQALSSQAAQVWSVQDTTKAPETLAPTTHSTDEAGPAAGGPIDATVAITAAAKPAVVKIFSGGGLGSGYIVSPQGLVVSNAHVTGAARPGDILKVEFSNGQTGEIKVLAANHNKDIAILQLPKNENGWPFLPLGESDALVEGQQVLAMGYPLGLPFTVTRGIVSGLGGGRGSIYVQQLQTDAAINHGNSGGPLLNMKGEIVGMNTAIAAPTAESGSIGIGFSIVSDDVKAAISQYAATGDINTSWMGIVVNRANPAAPDRGVLVEKVRPGSPAAKAGLREGDLILGADKKMLPKGAPGLHALARAIAQKKPGAELVILVGRGGDVAPLTVTLAAEK